MSTDLLGEGFREVADKMIGSLARLVSRAWFRRIEVVGMEEIAGRCPVIIVANHANGFVDPVLVMATSPRPVRFLAKATLWKVPGVKWLMAFAGVLPVHRAQDTGGTQGNERMFAASERELAHDGAVALFPEGTVNDALRLLPLKTGAARIALGAREEGAEGLCIVPVGLLYEDKTRPRTRVLVRAGNRIDLDEVMPFVAPDGASQGPDNREACDRLTSLIAGNLAQAATDYDRSQQLGMLTFAAGVYERRPDADPSRPLGLEVVEPTMRRLNSRPGPARDAVAEVAERYRAELQLAGLRDGDVVPGNTSSRVVDRVRLSAAKAVLAAPFGLVGAVVNAPAFVAVKAAATTRKMRPIDVANFRLLASLVAFPVTWVGWGFVARRVRVRHPFGFALLAGPVTGHAAVVTWEKWQDVRTARLQWRNTARDQDLLSYLRSERAAVVAAVGASLT
jgi:glycerol-3-phosphate O-acyltransferase/dihydroxyacetone phosphate acyltransferase